MPDLWKSLTKAGTLQQKEKKISWKTGQGIGRSSACIKETLLELLHWNINETSEYHLRKNSQRKKKSNFSVIRKLVPPDQNCSYVIMHIFNKFNTSNSFRGLSHHTLLVLFDQLCRVLVMLWTKPTVLLSLSLNSNQDAYAYSHDATSIVFNFVAKA